MKIAIHNSTRGFHPRWVAYCEDRGITVKRVNCHASDIIEQLRDCDGLMWHHSQMNPADLLVAKGILQALEHTGFPVFPDWHSGWHFDDKVAQKYLFEAIRAPFIPTWVFFDRQSALDWVEITEFPKVFKLRGGAGSINVRLARTKVEARQLVKQAFGRGFHNYDAWSSLKERWRMAWLKRSGYTEIVKGVARFVKPPPFARTLGRENGYIYFQEFIPGNNFDVRIVTIDGKAFSWKRFTRPNDFRASGSGNLSYEVTSIDFACAKTALRVSEELGLTCAAYDFLILEDGEPAICEVSYGFMGEVGDPCTGYWTSDLQWHSGPFNPQGWMVERLIKTIKNTKA